MTNLQNNSEQTNAGAGKFPKEVKKYTPEQQQKIGEIFIKVFDRKSLLVVREDIVFLLLNLQKFEAFFGNDKEFMDFSSIGAVPSIASVLDFLRITETSLSDIDDFAV